MPADERLSSFSGGQICQLTHSRLPRRGPDSGPERTNMYTEVFRKSYREKLTTVESYWLISAWPLQDHVVPSVTASPMLRAFSYSHTTSQEFGHNL